MASSSDAVHELGSFLTGTEAGQVADRLDDGDSLATALYAIGGSRRTQAKTLIAATGIGVDALPALLRAIEGARSARTSVEPLWTMPGHLAQTGRLTSSAPRLVDGARTSIVCSTFNFQQTSGLWTALRAAAGRPEISVRIYLDTAAANGRGNWQPPSTEEVAAHLHPAVVLRTKTFDDRLVRNHAKFLAIDHRFVLVTSANYSWSAEFGNVEFGVLVDNSNLTESIERDMRTAEPHLYEVVRRSR